MEWIEKLNSAINYIEENLGGEINLDEAARRACCSTYHFQRMFTYMAGYTLSEYVRKRRMSLAAVELQSSDIKVIDVAMKYGYDSPTAFNRAFKGIHGIAPSEAKKEGVIVKAFPPISFQITIKGVSEMEFRIEKKEAFRIVGISAPLDQDIEKNFEVVPKMWMEASTDGTIQKLAAMMETTSSAQMGNLPMGLLGVSACNEIDSWQYYIAVANNHSEVQDFETFMVPALTWAIFPGEGTNKSIQELEKRIVTEWLPTSGYEYGNGPDVEVYLNADPTNAKYEVWIPVVRKEN